MDTTAVLPGAPPEPGVGPDFGLIVRSWWRIGVAAVVAGQSMAFSLAVNLTPPEGWAYAIVHGLLIAAALAVCALLVPPLAREAWAALRARRVTVEMLFLVTLGGAFAASLIATFTRTGDVYYEVVSILLAIYAAGKTLAARSRARALRAVEDTRERFDHCERVGADGVARPVRAIEVGPGDRVRVRAGGAVAVDGVIRRGRGFVRETALTGEWRPVIRGPNEQLLAGTHSIDGDFEIEVTAAAGERRLDGILTAVAGAQLAPSGLQRAADRLTEAFLPAVLVVATGTFLYWLAVDTWVVALFNSMAVLLVACPCALGLATPLAVWQGLARMAEFGLVARTGDFLDGLARADVACLDKTGTLSAAHLQVAGVGFARAWQGRSAELAALLAPVAAGDSHPVARALATWATGAADPAAAAELLATTRVPGRGVVADVASRSGGPPRRVHVGEWELLPAEAQAEFGLDRSSPRGEGAGKSVHVAVEGRAAAVFAIAEGWRPGAEELFAELAHLGVAAEVLTGDPGQPRLKLDGVPWHAGLTPEDKVARIRTHLAAGRTPVLVGDGINDAAAMAAAPAAVAMNGGASLAMAAAPAVFVGEDLRFLPEAIRLARRVTRSVRVNLRFAAAYNVVGMTLAATGLLHPVVAALLMLGSSAFVSVRALRSVHAAGAGSAG
jgi:heavy metal translocating P-type ATPase